MTIEFLDRIPFSQHLKIPHQCDYIPVLNLVSGAARVLFGCYQYTWSSFWIQNKERIFYANVAESVKEEGLLNIGKGGAAMSFSLGVVACIFYARK